MSLQIYAVWNSDTQFLSKFLNSANIYLNKELGTHLNKHCIYDLIDELLQSFSYFCNTYFISAFNIESLKQFLSHFFPYFFLRIKKRILLAYCHLHIRLNKFLKLWLAVRSFWYSYYLLCCQFYLRFWPCF